MQNIEYSFFKTNDSAVSLIEKLFTDVLSELDIKYTF